MEQEWQITVRMLLAVVPFKTELNDALLLEWQCFDAHWWLRLWWSNGKVMGWNGLWIGQFVCELVFWCEPCLRHFTQTVSPGKLHFTYWTECCFRTNAPAKWNTPSPHLDLSMDDASAIIERSECLLSFLYYFNYFYYTSGFIWFIFLSSLFVSFLFVTFFAFFF